jgi:hypothetical protein
VDVSLFWPPGHLPEAFTSGFPLPGPSWIAPTAGDAAVANAAAANRTAASLRALVMFTSLPEVAYMPRGTLNECLRRVQIGRKRPSENDPVPQEGKGRFRLARVVRVQGRGLHASKTPARMPGWGLALRARAGEGGRALRAKHRTAG